MNILIPPKTLKEMLLTIDRRYINSHYLSSDLSLKNRVWTDVILYTNLILRQGIDLELIKIRSPITYALITLIVDESLVKDMYPIGFEVHNGQLIAICEVLNDNR